MAGLDNYDLLLPEYVLAVGGMVLLLAGVVVRDASQRIFSYLAIAVMAAAAAAVVMGIPQGRLNAFGGALIVDDFARFVKLLALAGAILVLIMAQGYFERERMGRFEFPVLVVFAVLGMMLMVSANDFIALYMGLELQSLGLYVLASFDRDSVRSTEAGLKYFVLGALSSGMMLYGISLIYGYAGTTNFGAVAEAVTGPAAPLGITFGLVFLTAGLAFKISAVPFHMWTPDVYEGAPTPITAFFSASPKIAAIALFTRTLISAFPDASISWVQIIVFISLMSMALGAVAAIGQNNIKRLMAYSSIGHMGYALIGLASDSPAGVQGLLIYLAIYLVTNIGVFACILAMRRGGTYVETITDLSGLAQNRPGFAFALAMLMFSLAGIPPLAGFFAKFYVFLAAVDAGLYLLAVAGVIASVVGAYYYLRIVKLMYFDQPAPAFEPRMDPSLGVLVAGSTAFNLLFVLGAGPLVTHAGVAAASLFP
jgi:NADH-quinone oxidoreductase subunit N